MRSESEIRSMLEESKGLRRLRERYACAYEAEMMKAASDGDVAAVKKNMDRAIEERRVVEEMRAEVEILQWVLG